MKDAMVRSMGESSNLLKQLSETFDQLIEEKCRAEILSWFDVHGDEIMERLKCGPNIFALPKTNNGARVPQWRRRMFRHR